MKKIQIFSVFAVFLMTLVFANTAKSLWPCERGSGNILSESRDLKNFSKVVLEGSGKIFITQGSPEQVKIETDDNILPLVLTQVKSSTLYIGSKKSICPKKLNIYLTMKDIRSFSIDGSGDIITNGIIETPELIIEISGSGDISINEIKANKFGIDLSGSGDIRAKGVVQNFAAEINGSGDINCEDLETSNTAIEINGSGDAVISVKDKLAVEINGSGDVLYIGNPQVFKEIAGSGKVRQKK